MRVNTTTQLLPFHPFANQFPLLNGAEFEKFVADIAANGLQEPITLYRGAVLDGRNRYRACLKLKLDPKFETFKGDDAAAFAYVFSKNIHRRHLKAKDKHDAIAALLKIAPEKSNRQIAEMVKVDHKTVAPVRAEKVATGEIPQLTKTVGKDRKARAQPKRTDVVAKKVAVAAPKPQSLDTIASEAVAPDELDLLREFARFVINRATAVKVDAKDYREWKELLERVKPLTLEQQKTVHVAVAEVMS
jgi:ParB-like chromosome segregation protein Spo0J